MSEEVIKMRLEGVYAAGAAFNQAEIDMSNIIRRGQLVISHVQGLMSSFISLGLASDSLAYAQDRLNEATMRYGPSSEQAKNATRQVEMAQASMQRTQLMAAFSTISMTTTLLVQSGVLNGLTVAKTLHTAASAASIPVTAGETAVTWGLVGALQAKAVALATLSGGLLVPLMLGGAALGMAAIGYGGMGGGGTNVNFGNATFVNPDVESAIDKYGARLKDEYRRGIE